MTLARHERHKNMEMALITMYKMLGDQPLNTLMFDSSKPEFENIYNTTWKDLEDHFLLKCFHGINWKSYQLTGLGWLVAIQVTGEIETPGFKKRVGLLSAAMKGKVKGRQQDALTDPHELAAETGLAEGWIFNVVQSNVWKHHLGRVGAEFDDSEMCIWVPIDFGMEAL